MSKYTAIGSSALTLVGALQWLAVRSAGSRLAVLFSLALVLVGVLVLTFSLGSRLLLGPRRADRLVVNLGLALLSLLVFLTLSEMALRYIFRDLTTTANMGGFFGQRWRKTLTLNSYGFREHEFSLEKPAGVYRIAVIGDSITFGQGVLPGERFSDRLEALLAQEGPSGLHYEVLNFGVPGTETVDHVRILEEKVLQTEPDFILLQWFSNDVEGHDKSGRPAEPLTWIPAELRETSVLLSLIHDLWRTLPQRLGRTQTYEAYMAARFSDPDSLASRQADQALQRFIRSAAEHDTPVGIVIFSRFNFGDHTLDFLVDRVVEVCAEQALVCVDLRPTFAPYRGQERLLWANFADPHPGAHAHRLVADQLLVSYRSVWIGE